MNNIFGWSLIIIIRSMINRGRIIFRWYLKKYIFSVLIWKEKIGGVRIMLLIHDSSKILVKRAIMLRSNLLFLRKELYLKRKERKQLTNDERVEMTMRLDRRKLEQSGTISMCTYGNSQAARNRSLGGKGRNKEREGRISVEWLWSVNNDFPGNINVSARAVVQVVRFGPCPALPFNLVALPLLISFRSTGWFPLHHRRSFDAISPFVWNGLESLSECTIRKVDTGSTGC